MSVRDAFRNSVNLVFIRLMRDVVNYHLYREPESIGRILEDPADPRREAYLTRFADREGSEFMRQFYRKYQGKTAAEALDLIIGGIRATPPRLATILRSVNPEASVEDLRALLSARLPDVILPDDAVAALHRKYAPDAFSLMDRGYIARCIRSSCGRSTPARASGREPSRTRSARAPTSGRRFTVGSSDLAAQCAGHAHRESAGARGLPRDPAWLAAPRLSLRVARAVARERGRRVRRQARRPRRADGHHREQRAALSDRHGGADRLRPGHALRDAASPPGRGGPAGTGARDRGGSPAAPSPTWWRKARRGGC